MKCPRCKQDNPPAAQFCLQCGTPLKAADAGGIPQSSYADVQRESERLTGALTEALEQQTATSEILRIISNSPTDVQPVFATILASATRLCDASFGVLFRVEGESLLLAAHHKLSSQEIAALEQVYPQPLDGGAIPARAGWSDLSFMYMMSQATPQTRSGTFSARSAFARLCRCRCLRMEKSSVFCRSGVEPSARSQRRTLNCSRPLLTKQ